MPKRLFWSGLEAAQVAELERLANAGPSPQFHPTHGWTLAFHLVPTVLLIAITLGILRFELGRWSCGEGLSVTSPGGVALGLSFAALGWVGLITFERLHGGPKNGWYVTDAALVHRQGPIVERHEWSSVVPLGWEWTETSTQVLNGKRIFSRPSDLTDRALVKNYAGQTSRSSEWSFGVEGTEQQVAIADARGEAFDGFVSELQRRVRTATPPIAAEQTSVFWPPWPMWLAVVLIGGMVMSAASLSLGGNRWLERLKLAEELNDFSAMYGTATPQALERLTSSSALLFTTRHLFEKHAAAVPADRRPQLELAHQLASQAACGEARRVLALTPAAGATNLRRALEALDAAQPTSDTSIELELIRREALGEWTAWWLERTDGAWQRAAQGHEVALLHFWLQTGTRTVTLQRGLDAPHGWELHGFDESWPVDVQALARLVLEALHGAAGAPEPGHELQVGVGGFVTTIRDERLKPIAAFVDTTCR